MTSTIVYFNRIALIILGETLVDHSWARSGILFCLCSLAAFYLLVASPWVTTSSYSQTSEANPLARVDRIRNPHYLDGDRSLIESYQLGSKQL